MVCEKKHIEIPTCLQFVCFKCFQNVLHDNKLSILYPFSMSYRTGEEAGVPGGNSRSMGRTCKEVVIKLPTLEAWGKRDDHKTTMPYFINVCLYFCSSSVSTFVCSLVCYTIISICSVLRLWLVCLFTVYPAVFVSLWSPTDCQQIFPCIVCNLCDAGVVPCLCFHD